MARLIVVAFLVASVTATTPAPTATTTATGSNCQALKDAYRDSACCGVPTKVTDYSLGGSGTQSVPKHSVMNGGITNKCAGKTLLILLLIRPPSRASSRIPTAPSTIFLMVSLMRWSRPAPTSPRDTKVTLMRPEDIYGQVPWLRVLVRGPVFQSSQSTTSTA